MSGFLSSIGNMGPGASALGGAASGAMQLVGLIPARSVGGIIPNCVVSEQHRSDLQVTEHPVEVGAAITDHSYVRPVELVIHALWSNSSQISAMAAGLLSGNIPLGDVLGMATEGYAAQMYQKLLALQATRQTMTVVTGKKSYQNMLITSISVANDARNEYGLDCTINCRQVILVQTQSATLAPMQQHQRPWDTAPVQEGGPVTPRPSPGSTARALVQMGRTPINDAHGAVPGPV